MSNEIQKIQNLIEGLTNVEGLSVPTATTEISPIASKLDDGFGSLQEISYEELLEANEKVTIAQRRIQNQNIDKIEKHIKEAKPKSGYLGEDADDLFC